MLKIQIGTIGYKKNSNYLKTFPLYTDKTEELNFEIKNFYNSACKMFIVDLVNYLKNNH